MTTVDTLALLADRFGVAVHPAAMDPVAVVSPEKLVEVCAFLRDDPRLRFDLLNDLAFVDYLEPDTKKAAKAGFEPHVEVVYHLSSFARPGARLTLKVILPRESPTVPTVSHLWPTADWHEREAFDLGGVTFVGHPDPRRLLLADDWVGHPLRKDYEFPAEYHGIRCR